MSLTWAERWASVREDIAALPLWLAGAAFLAIGLAVAWGPLAYVFLLAFTEPAACAR